MLNMLGVVAVAYALSGSVAANEDRCRQLEQLGREYAGRVLSLPEQVIKRRMVAWYRANCKKAG